jgi:shikimate dehydrogenase
MTDHYAVVGKPIAHSKSPLIHSLFAQQTTQDMEYRAELGDLVNFEKQVSQWFAAGLRGLNVTLPFKERALALATKKTARALLAGAANTLRLDETGFGIEADNTDGIGLMRDLQDRLGVEIQDKRVLVLGAGGATRGILGPLLEAGPARLVLTNRTEARAVDLVVAMQRARNAKALIFNSQTELAQQSTGFDLVINATSTSLSGEIPEVPDSIWAEHTMAYDLAYTSSGETAFLVFAQTHGVKNYADGLGMLVEQAAEAFYWWRGVAPDTNAVLKQIRILLATP